MREQFEKLPEIKNKIHLVEFRSDTKKFTDRYSVVDKQSTYKRSFVKGAWYSFQEQQKRIDLIKEKIDMIYNACEDNERVANLLDELKELLK